MLCGVKKYKSVHRIIKSDRINTLRKQYDSFVEADKKRKERNEYILGKLDKMVYSNALVPVRSMHTTIIHRPSAMYPGYQPEVSVTPTVLPTAVIKSQNTPVQKMDDTYLIQEISKKFILIPKFGSPVINSYLDQTTPVSSDDIVQGIHGTQAVNTLKMQQPSSENTDWKNKYEILNKLKKEETENQSVQVAQSLPETLLNNTNENLVGSDNVMIKSTSHNIEYEDLNDLPEKDIYDEKKNFKSEVNRDISDTANIKTDPLLSKVSRNDIDVDAVGNINYSLQNTYLESNYTEPSVTNTLADATNYVANTEEYNSSEAINPPLVSGQINYVEHPSAIDNNYGNDEQYNYIDPNQFTPSNQQIYDTNEMTEENFADHSIGNVYVENRDGTISHSEALTEQHQSGNIKKDLYMQEQDAGDAQDLCPKEFSKEMNNDPIITSGSGAPDYVNYNPDLVGVDELTSNDTYQMKNSYDTVSERTAQQNNADVIDSTVEQKIPPEPISELKESAIDNEQAADMESIQDFDAEQRELFYTEHPADSYVYQPDDDNINSQEYQQNQLYQQNETYPENEIYPHSTNYYDGLQNQQMYPVDVKEDEEHLNSRYDASYQQQYVDPYESVYHKQPQEHQKPEIQDVQPEQTEAVYVEQLYDNEDKITEKLDIEDGYNESTTEGVIPEVEEIKQPDAK